MIDLGLLSSESWIQSFPVHMGHFPRSRRWDTKHTSTKKQLKLLELPIGQRGNQRKFLKNENEDITDQNLWDTTEVLLRGKFIALQAFIRLEERIQLDNFTAQQQKTEK